MHPAVSNGAYDVARVREDFPALSLKVYGKPLVYLDNAASAQKPNAVLDRMTQAYNSEYANVHRGLHYLANTATEAYEGGRAKVAKFLNAGRNEEIVFTRNATEAINLVASSWGEPNIGEGDEIVLSIMEHHSNIVPWHFLRERHGAAYHADRPRCHERAITEVAGVQHVLGEEHLCGHRDRHECERSDCPGDGHGDHAVSGKRRERAGGVTGIGGIES